MSATVCPASSDTPRDAARAPSDAALDTLMAAASALAPQRRARFDLLVVMGATVAELGAVFGVPGVARPVIA